MGTAERDARLAGRWQLLQQSAERARANANNGMLIRIRMDYNERALAVLRSAPAPAGIYGADGRSRPSRAEALTD